MSQVPQKVSRREGSSTDTWLCAGLAFYLSTVVVEGPVRWFSVIAGIPNALYVRDAVLALLVAVIFARGLLQDRIHVPIALAGALLAAHATVGLALGLPLFQVLFGAKIFLPLLCGLAMGPVLARRISGVLGFARLAMVVTLAGILLNFAYGKMPWEGLEYDSAFGEVTAAVEWWIPGGIRRLPGFTRASFTAAIILSLTGVLSMISLRSLWIRAVIALACVLGVVLTTSKGVLVALLPAAGWLLLRHGSGRPAVGAVLTGLFAVLGIAMPALSVGYDLESWSRSLPALVASVHDRFASMWPSAFELLPGRTGWLTGGGLGSIGTPQIYGNEAHRQNAGDNLWIFVFVNFGLSGLIYYFAPAVAAWRLAQESRSQSAQACIAVTMVAYGYGMVSNLLESSFFGIVLGSCVAIALDRSHATASRGVSPGRARA